MIDTLQTVAHLLAVCELLLMGNQGQRSINGAVKSSLEESHAEWAGERVMQSNVHMFHPIYFCMRVVQPCMDGIPPPPAPLSSNTEALCQPLVLGGRHLVNTKILVMAYCVAVWVTVL